ncbi:MAG TPA: VacJ family lipoprotein [Caulobacteraceae bacterium]
MNRQAFLLAAVATGLIAAGGPVIAQTARAHDASNADGQAAGPGLADPAAPDPAATAPVSDSATGLIPDPWSGPNHTSYRVTRAIDRAAIAPVIRTYVRVVPTPVRTGLDNAINNLDEPRTVANDVLQGRFKPAGKATARFVINSTVGVAGLVDVASRIGIEKHESDFGQTLGRYGVKSGPYIFVPLAGPSSLRDGAGRLVDIFADPLGLLVGGLGTVFGDVRAGVGAVTERTSADDQLKQVDSTFTDPYASIRSVYSQQRASQIAVARGHDQEDVSQLPDFGAAPQIAPTAQAKPAAAKPVAADPVPSDPAPPSPAQPCRHLECYDAP